MFFWSGNLVGAQKLIWQKSLRNTGHGDKIEGPCFKNITNFLENMVRNPNFIWTSI